MFVLSQLIGLTIVNQYIDHQTTTETGNVTWQSLPYDVQRPEIEENESPLYIMAAILVGTLLIFLLIRFNITSVWKYWFLFALVITLSIALKPFIGSSFAILLSFIIGIWRVFKPNIYVHNFSELFIYGGLAAIFVPILNISSAFILLILISLYDAYAVWQSKHMIKLAKFQSKAKMFAGLFIPYKLPALSLKKNKVKKKQIIKIKVDNAVLGGGDIGFPLIFAGVVMKTLMLSEPVLDAYLKTLIITLTTTIALLWLLLAAKKDRFYPAMPFLSAGCFIGYVILLII